MLLEPCPHPLVLTISTSSTCGNAWGFLGWGNAEKCMLRRGCPNYWGWLSHLPHLYDEGTSVKNAKSHEDIHMPVCVCVLVAQSCPTLCDPMDYSPNRLLCPWDFPGKMEWVAIPFSKRSSQLRDWTMFSCIKGRFFTVWAIKETHIYRERLPGSASGKEPACQCRRLKGCGFDL